MTDITKYLENQQALAEHKNLISKNKVSEQSRRSADLIAKKQNKLLESDVKPFFQEIENNDECSMPTQSSAPILSSATEDTEPASGSEYAPSSEDEDTPGTSYVRPQRCSSTQQMKKVIDDGDKATYHQRTQTWKNNLKIIQSGGKVEEKHCTADIKYIHDGHNDGLGIHEAGVSLRIPNYIWNQLYKYQRTGVKWLWELHRLQSGGLLGDEMGLGKTVQLIAFFAGLSKTDEGTWGGLGPSIIVAPATVIYQWVSHFHYWFPGLRVAVLHNSGSYTGRHHSLIRELHDAHGVLLLTYAGIVKYERELTCRNWHYIVLDEGHKIRNPDTQVSKAVKKFCTPHKILITGSPMQNSLQELWSLFDFMCPGLLGTQTAFMEFFAMPITQGGYSNATQLQEVTAYEIAKSLKNMITPYMLRRTKAEVQQYINLPEKTEQVLFCSLSQEQKDLYLGYLMGGTVRSILDKDHRYGEPYRARILVAISTLRKICNHPDLYLCEAYEDNSNSISEDNFGYWKRSGKMTVVHSLLKIWNKQGHRALIFSQSRSMLIILEQFLMQSKYKYLKMDGTVGVGLRQNIIKTFNENQEYLVLLATTRVGGLGVNLTGADRVIIYDPDWNPATDNQAKERAWRIGQRRDVTVYRLLSAGTIEEKIYQRQVFKHLLGNKVLVDPNQKNPLKTSHLQGLFTLEEPNRDGETETSSIFNDSRVKVGKKEARCDKNVHLSGGVSFSMEKLAAMRKLARRISSKIARESAPVLPDARERYKVHRDMLLNPPKVDPKEINIVNDNETCASFESALSELEIINLHSKAEHLKQLLMVNSTEEENVKVIAPNTEEKADTENYKRQDIEICNNLSRQTVVDGTCECQETVIHERLSDSESGIRSIQQLNRCDNNPQETLHSGKPSTDDIKRTSNNKINKRKHNSFAFSDVKGLVSIKKVKKKLKEDSEMKDDDYVLSKLYAKSGLQSALEHDKIVGLDKKEERHKLKQEACKRAKRALQALKKSARK